MDLNRKDSDLIQLHCVNRRSRVLTEINGVNRVVCDVSGI